MRRRMIGRGFEGLELPPAPGLRPAPAFEAAGVDASDRVFPIPNDASAVRVTAAAVDQIRGRMIFGLAL